MTSMEINVTIRDGTGSILATQTGFTDAFGFFNITFTVGNWDDTEVELEEEVSHEKSFLH